MDVDVEHPGALNEVHQLGAESSSFKPSIAEDQLEETNLTLKRKLETLEGTEALSSSEIPVKVETLVLPTDQPVKDEEPRLTISRHPAFIPIPDTGDPPLCTTDLTVMNRSLHEMGYRYLPAGLAEPGAVLRYRTIESRPTSLRISWEDRSSFIRVTEDGLGAGGQGGFRSARCNAPVREGKWYMEVKIEKGGGEGKGQSNAREGAHVRLGWGRREAPLNGPIGLDGYSYGMRDKTGEKFTLSRPKPYGRPFSTGDVVGMYISLPPLRTPDPNDPCDPARLKRERIAIVSKGQEYFEMLEYPQSKEMVALMRNTSKSLLSNSLAASGNNTSPSKKSTIVKNLPGRSRKPKVVGPILRPLPTLGPQAHISFFVNGECQGVAFQDLYDFLQLRQLPTEKEKVKRNTQHVDNPFDDGTLGYYPFISLYNDARIRMNPGPDFEFPPPNDIDALLNPMWSNAGVVKEYMDSKERTWRPMCERYCEWMQEMWAQDVIDEELAKVTAKEATEEEEVARARNAAKEKRKQEAAAKKKLKAEASSNLAGPSSRAATTPSDDRFGPEIDEFLESAAASPSSKHEEESMRGISEEPKLGDLVDARDSTPGSGIDADELLEGDSEYDAELLGMTEDGTPEEDRERHLDASIREMLGFEQGYTSEG